eukprot:7184712-Pyramimonas_sp.AAC.1
MLLDCRSFSSVLLLLDPRSSSSSYSSSSSSSSVLLLEIRRSMLNGPKSAQERSESAPRGGN